MRGRSEFVKTNSTDEVSRPGVVLYETEVVLEFGLGVTLEPGRITPLSPVENEVAVLT